MKTKKIISASAIALLAFGVTGATFAPANANISTVSPTTATAANTDNSYQLSFSSSTNNSVTFNYHFGKNIKLVNQDGILGIMVGDEFQELPKTVQTKDGTTVTGTWTTLNGKLIFNFGKKDTHSKPGATTANEYTECIWRGTTNGMITGAIGGVVGGPGAASAGALLGTIGGFVSSHITCP